MMRKAFTLAELLIALAILGVIATFTIPKILDSGSSSQYNSMAKETASMLSGAFQNYKLDNSISASTIVGDFTPYMNYVAVDTTTSIDTFNGGTSLSCSGTGYCLKLHNGGILWYRTDISFGSTDTTSLIYVVFDPDGTYGGSTTGPSKGTLFHLYTNGRLVTAQDTLPNSYYDGGGPYSGPVTWPNTNPEYFSWSN